MLHEIGLLVVPSYGFTGPQEEAKVSEAVVRGEGAVFDQLRGGVEFAKEARAADAARGLGEGVTGGNQVRIVGELFIGGYFPGGVTKEDFPVGVEGVPLTVPVDLVAHMPTGEAVVDDARAEAGSPAELIEDFGVEAAVSLTVVGEAMQRIGRGSLATVVVETGADEKLAQDKGLFFRGG
jgi:hypothetical protein